MRILLEEILEKMRRRIPSNRSIIYPFLEGICKASEKASLLGHARRRFGRYLAVEILIFASICFGVVLLMIIPILPLWARIIAILVFAYRVVTMALAHISILLLNTGKSTPGQRIHSRLRYIGLTALNFLEVLIFGALLLLCFVDLVKPSQHYSQIFSSLFDIIHYNFLVAITFGTGRIYPLTPMAYAQHVLVSALGIEIIVVVLAIVLSIPSEDEVMKRDELSESEYWEWRADFFENIEWARDHKLRQFVVEKLAGRGLRCVADIGCGIGQLCLNLASEGYSVFGIDRSKKMIEFAKRNAPPGITYQQGDACCLPLPDNCVNAVVMRMLLHNVLPEWQRALLEAKRILNDEGILIVIEGFPPNEESWSFFQDVLKEVHQRHFFRKELLLEGIKWAGFEIEVEEKIVIQNVSIRSWLMNSVPQKRKLEPLLKAHLQMPEECKLAYNFRQMHGDAIVDMTFLAVTATLQKDIA